jgi:hypothetical protein
MELNIADTFVSHDQSMVSHWALSVDQMKNGFRTFLKIAVRRYVNSERKNGLRITILSKSKEEATSHDVGCDNVVWSI